MRIQASASRQLSANRSPLAAARRLDAHAQRRIG
jgi:hypothetical protein